MALFGKKKEKEAPVAVETKTAPAAKPSLTAPRSATSAIIRPRVTEKAAILTEKNVYAFEVRRDATKHEIKDAVKALYNVTPLRVRVVNKEPRHFMSRMRGRDTMEHGMRKAYVYLKKGDRIELV
ncbi:MAG TPA: 50S ribosomal protein L23 [Candidatus Paceibacterota bacterium]|nr:50S ribosomal protein L23 [Candidatus Paceibacterota bacterium]